MKPINLVLVALLAIPAAAMAGQSDHGGHRSHSFHHGHSNNHHSGRGINERQREQARRIRAGIRSGDLTRKEAWRLGHEQRDIRREERFYRRDGHFSRWERAEVRRELNSADRHIRRQRNDRQER